MNWLLVTAADLLHHLNRHPVTAVALVLALTVAVRRVMVTLDKLMVTFGKQTGCVRRDIVELARTPPRRARAPPPTPATAALLLRLRRHRR